MEDLAEKLILQERRIGELERKCNISNDFLSEEYTNKSASASASTSLCKFFQLEKLRRVVDSGKENFSFFFKHISQRIPKTNLFFFIFQEKVAFFAYINWDQETPSRRHILISDVVRTNLGDHFKFSGIFNADLGHTFSHGKATVL